jgi:hypothetical protein
MEVELQLIQIGYRPIRWQGNFYSRKMLFEISLDRQDELLNGSCDENRRKVCTDARVKHRSEMSSKKPIGSLIDSMLGDVTGATKEDKIENKMSSDPFGGHMFTNHRLFTDN